MFRKVLRKCHNINRRLRLEQCLFVFALQAAGQLEFTCLDSSAGCFGYLRFSLTTTVCFSIEQRVYHQSLLLAIGVIIGPFQALGVTHIGPFQAIQLAATQTNVRGHRPILYSPVVLTPSAPFALLGKLHITNGLNSVQQKGRRWVLRSPLPVCIPPYSKRGLSPRNKNINEVYVGVNQWCEIFVPMRPCRHIRGAPSNNQNGRSSSSLSPTSIIATSGRSSFEP